MAMAIFFLISILIMIPFTLMLHVSKKNGVEKELKRSQTDQQKKQQSCIYLEEHLSYRQRSSKAFTPKLISIGPFHFNGVRKLPMEHVKLMYLQCCLERPSQKLKQLDFEAKKAFIRDFIQEQKERICQCYAGYNSKCESYDTSFADNVLMDAFFIIELFLREEKSSEYSEDEIIKSKRKRIGVRDDLILMENQLPYFLLRELYDLVLPTDCPSFDRLTQNYFLPLPLIIGNPEGPDHCCSAFFSSCMEDCFRSFFYCFWTRQCTICCKPEYSDGDYHVAIPISNAPPLHFTDFFRDLVLRRKTCDEGWSSSYSTGNRPLLEGSSSSSEGMTDVSSSGGPIISSPLRGKRKIQEVSAMASPIGDRFVAIPAATKLQRAGVKLKASKEESMFNIKFENGVLSIPPLELDDCTEGRLLNLIAYEECQYLEEANINVFSYIKFIESLVKTKHDADLLIDKGVIVNKLAGGVKEVKEMLQSLCKDIILPSFFYQDVCQQLKIHRGNCWYRIVAGFTHEYFSKPWLRVGTVIAILVFFMACLRFILPYSGIAPPVKHSG